jgi:D-alanine-D-alanine ligase
MAALDRQKYTPIGLDAAALSAGPLGVAGPPPIEAAREAPRQVGNDADDLVPVALSDLSPDGHGRPDVVFIALHGRGGEDGTIQGMLDLLGIPYTGSGVLASALAIDKAMTKRVLRSEGIPVPDDLVLVQEDGTREDQARLIEGALGYPVVVKPNREGSTIGCSLARDSAGLSRAIAEAFRHDTTVMAEQYVQGTEITVGLLGNRRPDALPIVEIVPRGGFYDYDAKYAPGGSEHITPARISETAEELARHYAIRAHQVVGCRGFSRVDMIVTEDQPMVLEINTIPGMTPTSLLPDAARAAGIGFGQLLDRIIGLALNA